MRVRAELRQFDPEQVRIVERYWGVDPQQVQRTEDELVAYLDGELDADASELVERRLSEDAAYRRQLRQLQHYQYQYQNEQVSLLI